jgi:perosamine synthetase
MIRIAQPFIGEEEKAAVLAVLDSGQLVNGPVTRELEEEFAREVSGTAEAVAVANGTAALHLALLAHGIGPGDEVVTTAFTFQATANMVLATGARPVFVDIGDDYNIDPSLIEAAITPRTKAILPVHLFGLLCDMDAIGAIARRHGLKVVEDAAQAHGAQVCGNRAGSFGTGCFSFYATKNMTSGEGGMVTADDGAFAERLRLLRSHGEESRYSSAVLGFNYRLSEMAAALGISQLRKLALFNKKRLENARYLSEHLEGVILPPPSWDGASSWHLYTIAVRSGREELSAWLRDRGIQSGVYYPTPVPDQPLYRGLDYSGECCPNARRLAAQVISLPVHPGLSQEDLDTIVAAVNEWTWSRRTVT